MRVSTLLLSLAVVSCLLLSTVSGASVSGRVASLSGSVEKGVTLQAALVGADANTAAIEAVTDAQGAYAFDLPAGAYRVHVKTGGVEGEAASRLSRATPEAAVVTVASSNIANVDFIAFRRSARFDLTGTIVGAASSGSSVSVLKQLSSLEIQVALASAPAVVVAKTTVISNDIAYFEFIGLPTETYILSVKSSLPTRTYNFASPSLTIALTGSAHVQPTVDITYKQAAATELQGNSTFNSILLLVALVALLYKDQSLSLARGALKSAQTRNPAHLRSAVSALFASSSSAAGSFAPAASEERPASRKPKYPAKKEKTHVSTFVRYDSLPAAQQPNTTTSPVAERPAPTPAPVATPAPARVEPKQQAKAESKAKKAPAPTPVVAAPAPVAAAPAPVKATPKPTPAPVAAPAPKPVAAPKPVVPTPAPAPVVAAVAPAAAAASTNSAKFCAECGNKRPDASAKFCSECGAKY